MRTYIVLSYESLHPKRGEFTLNKCILIGIPIQFLLQNCLLKTKLGRDEMLMASYRCQCFSARAAMEVDLLLYLLHKCCFFTTNAIQRWGLD